MEIALTIAAMIVLLLVLGFFSGSEIAIVHSDKARLRHRARQGNQGSRLALRMFERPEMLLGTTLVGTNIALVLVTVLATALMIRFFGALGELYAFLFFTPVILILGEVVPKSVYQQEADNLTPRIIYPLFAFSLLFWPVVFVFSRAARLAARLVGAGTPGAGMFAVREQLRAVLETAEGAMNIDVFDRARIRNVIRFGELNAGDVMVPASEMMAVDTGRGAADMSGLVSNTGYTHLPVYEGARSNVVGMISCSAWDILQPGFAARPLADLIRPALYVTEAQSLSELLPVLRARDDQSAIVVDEYGSAIGMLTADRVFETIVGRVKVGQTYEGRVETPQPGYEEIDEDAFLMDGRLPLSQVNEILQTSIGLRDVHTIGGFLEAQFRRIPQVGESVEEAGYVFTVAEASERMIVKVRVERAGN